MSLLSKTFFTLRKTRRRKQTFQFGFICIGLLVYIGLSSVVQDEVKSKPSKAAEEVTCNIPKLDPFNPTMINYDELPTCDGNGSYPLIFTTDLDNHIINVEPPDKYGYSSCCYRSLFRSNGDSDVLESSECVQLTTKKAKIPTDIEHIAVECTKSDNSSNNHIVDAFGFIQRKSNVEDRILDIVKEPSELSLNVVILQVDSVSHMQLVRDMPKSYHYLIQNLSAIGMNSYVKVGENTFPNLIPLLTGLSQEQLADICWKSPSGFLDDCPFIWKKFSSRGYRTSLFEDCAQISAFNYFMEGFREIPVDYYLHPLTLFMEKNLMFNNLACKGPRFSSDILLDQMNRMAWTMRNVGKYFQLVMTASLTHDYQGEARLLDDILLKHLNFFNQNGFFNQTLYIIMSDHGYRLGSISDTQQGRIEDKMPFLYFIFPPWFIDLHPEAIGNLKRNQDKMTTPFDLHETLKDIIAMLDGNFHNELLDFQNISRGISLFRKEFPTNRTCLMAGISLEFCVCTELTPVFYDYGGVVKEAANTFIKSTNQKLASQKECVELSLGRVLQAFDVRMNGQENQELQKLMIQVETTPGEGQFEIMVNRRRPLGLLMNSAWNLTSVIRINRYGNQSHCADELALKIYCCCRDTLGNTALPTVNLDLPLVF